MPRRRTRLFLPTLACLLSGVLAVPAVATPTQPPGTSPAPAPAPAPADEGSVAHSSEVSGPVLFARAGAGTAQFRVGERSRPVAPGLQHTRFDRYDARGWVRVHALTADLGAAGLRLDYAAPGKVSAPGPLTTALHRDRAVAGVNGDFFDIGDTGAPLGVGVDRQRGVLHGSASGWSNAFTLDRAGVARIAETYLQASITRPGKAPLAATNLNAPVVHTDGIGIYTPDWGSVARSRVLPGQPARREVVVRGGRVRANRTALSTGPIPTGTIHLVGSGAGARQLAGLDVGTRVSVAYGVNTPATRVAVGGNVVLLRDGKVLAPNDVEMHPRTAIGIDHDLNRLIILAADGRQAHSRGLTMRETAALLKQLGAEDGLNLDGGGSATMMARESGESLGVVNAPSDGRLRSVPNGLGFTTTAGSGRLTGIRIEPVGDEADSHRVLRGLSRALVARGHDETLAPVPAEPTWAGSTEVAPAGGPAVRSVVVGRRTGSGTVTATAGGASGTFDLRVLGPVHRLEASVPAMALAGRGHSATLDVRGYDARGFGTWVEPRDLRPVYDRDKLHVRRTARGLVVTARVGSASEVLTLRAGGRRTHVGVTVGLARAVVHPLDGVDGWRASAAPAKADATLQDTADRRGRSGGAVALRYALLGGAPRVASVTAGPPLPLPSRTRRVGLWVRGDGLGPALRATVRDAAGVRATLPLGGRVRWEGWRFVAAPLPAGLAEPVSLVRLQAVETEPARRYRGTLAFDDLTAFTERVATVPVTAPLRDPAVADLGPVPSGGLRVAVMSGAAVPAAAPDGPAAQRARRALREIVAARPDLVLLNGDLVAGGTDAAMTLARRLIREELEGKVAWHYLPGDRELGGGDLDAFRAEFGEPVQVVDHAGTRFVLLNSARGGFRLSGFAQLVRLRAQLAAAAADTAVGSVVVVAHHPTGDPAAGGTAALADPREGDLVEELLARFGSDSGKPAAYVGSHGRRFDLTRTDGVVHVHAGPVSAPAAGSFAGWSLLRVDPEAAAGLAAELRPFVDALTVDAPGSLAVGAAADAHATLTQQGRRRRVGYPMSAQWLPSVTVHVGAPATAPATAVVAYQPQLGRLTGLRPGVAELRVRVNEVTARHVVTVG